MQKEIKCSDCMIHSSVRVVDDPSGENEKEGLLRRIVRVILPYVKSPDTSNSDHTQNRRRLS
jgi:hypothetical protein